MTGDSWGCRPVARALSNLPPSHPIIEAGASPGQLPGGGSICSLVAGCNEFVPRLPLNRAHLGKHALLLCPV